MNNKSFCCDGGDFQLAESLGAQSATDTAPALYFYHPDHLGSTAMVTDEDGHITQNVVYIPFGEVFVEERNGSWASPYLFNAKELDEETGLYYYGARYLDPAGARWLSVDPMFEKYMGMTPYNYCAGNPVKMVDPDGKAAVKVIITAYRLIKKAYKIYKKTGKLSPANLKKAGISELVDIADDLSTIFSGTSSTMDKISAGADLLLGTDFNSKSSRAVRKGASDSKVRESIETGQEAHRQIEKELKETRGASIEETVVLKDRSKVRKDAILPDNTAVIIKPNTPTGHKSAEKREKLMRDNGYNTETIFYDPNNPAYKPGSSTYMGPKNKK